MMTTTSIIISRNNDEQIAKRDEMRKKDIKKSESRGVCDEMIKWIWGRTRDRVRLAITPCALLISSRVRLGHEDDPIKREDEIIKNHLSWLRSSRDLRMRNEKCLHFLVAGHAGTTQNIINSTFSSLMCLFFSIPRRHSLYMLLKKRLKINIISLVRWPEDQRREGEKWEKDTPRSFELRNSSWGVARESIARSLTVWDVLNRETIQLSWVG